VLDREQMSETIARMARDVLQECGDVGNLVLIGVRTRGVPLAEAIAAEIEAANGAAVPIGILDITLYRDDLSTIAPHPVVKETRFPGPIDGRTLVLCDDVLFTGRTTRAALEALVDFGRPRRVALAVLIDRGHRELPIQADIVGKVIETSREDQVEVRFEATDGDERVEILERET
jgi:pyrimidine operon attenuation protein/uracil phosphoribosyltransferase